MLDTRIVVEEPAFVSLGDHRAFLEALAGRIATVLLSNCLEIGRRHLLLTTVVSLLLQGQLSEFADSLRGR